MRRKQPITVEKWMIVCYRVQHKIVKIFFMEMMVHPFPALGSAPLESNKESDKRDVAVFPPDRVIWFRSPGNFSRPSPVFSDALTIGIFKPIGRACHLRLASIVPPSGGVCIQSNWILNRSRRCDWGLPRVWAFK